MTEIAEAKKIGKMTKKDMIGEIKEELIIYFREGFINPKSFFEFDNLKFNNIYDILKIHFILSKEVQDYVLGLEENIRNIKNSTKLKKIIFYGEVRGNIDWNRTMEYRANTLYKDRTRFVCDNVDKLYDTKENIILKKAVSIIYNIIHVELGMDRFIKQGWYKNGEKLSWIISNIYKGNIYIKRIDISNVNITDKMILDVSKSRNKLYRDSAMIVKLYRDIMALKEEHINDLFSETFIEMKSANEVFELYCIFKYMKKRFSITNLEYNIMDGREECLASLEDEEYIYKVYHNRTGSSYLNFRIGVSEVENNENIFLKKKVKSLKRKSEIYREIENKDISNIFWSGRPDLLILKIHKESETIPYIEIGEVKYTNDRVYMYRGLEELLEYIYFVKDRDYDYIEDIDIKGILFVDDIKLDKYNFNKIKIINRYYL